MNLVNIASKINKGLNTKAGKIAMKTVAIGSLATVAYDAHCNGKMQADSYQKTKDADATCSSFLNSRSLKRPSAIQGGLKKELFNFELDNNIRGFINSGVGYVKGITDMIISDIVPTALATTALITKGAVSKVSMAGLAAYGAITLLQDICGIGNKKYL